MNNLPLGLAAALAMALMGAGCSSGRGPKVLPPPVVVEKTAVEKPKAPVPRVTTSARFVLTQGVLPEAKGPLAFLADDAALRAGKVTLTKAQADAALAEFTRLTGAEVQSTMRASQASGNLAKFSIRLDSRSERRKPPFDTVTVCGVPFTTKDAKVDLEVFPQVFEDGDIRFQATVWVATFEGFVGYTRGGPVGQGDSVNMPADFYQPIFTENSVTVQVRMRSGETIVLRGDGRKKLKSADLVNNLPLDWRMSADKTLLVFLTAAGEPAKR
ncbi:MAG: hypothetical protein WC661_17080 [Opitutaceae bacterium]|jgi:hypothetical protein